MESQQSEELNEIQIRQQLQERNRQIDEQLNQEKILIQFKQECPQCSREYSEIKSLCQKCVKEIKINKTTYSLFTGSFVTGTLISGLVFSLSSITCISTGFFISILYNTVNRIKNY